MEIAKDVLEYVAEAYEVEPEALTFHNIAYFEQRRASISDIATLIDNGLPAAAAFLIDFHDIDPESSLDKSALSELACQSLAKKILQHAIKRRKGLLY